MCIQMQAAATKTEKLLAALHMGLRQKNIDTQESMMRDRLPECDTPSKLTLARRGFCSDQLLCS